MKNKAGGLDFYADSPYLQMNMTCKICTDHRSHNETAKRKFHVILLERELHLSQKHVKKKIKDFLSGNTEIILASDNWTEDRDTINWAFILLIKNYLNNERVTLIFFLNDTYQWWKAWFFISCWWSMKIQSQTRRRKERSFRKNRLWAVNCKQRVQIRKKFWSISVADLFSNRQTIWD